MASLNEVQLIGNTGIDPDIKQTSNGNKYAIFTFATTDKRKDAPDTTQWHKVVCWRPYWGFAPQMQLFSIMSFRFVGGDSWGVAEQLTSGVVL